MKKRKRKKNTFTIMWNSWILKKNFQRMISYFKNWCPYWRCYHHECFISWMASLDIISWRWTTTVLIKLLLELNRCSNCILQLLFRLELKVKWEFHKIRVKKLFSLLNEQKHIFKQNQNSQQSKKYLEWKNWTTRLQH